MEWLQLNHEKSVVWHMASSNLEFYTQFVSLNLCHAHQALSKQLKHQIAKICVFRCSTASMTTHFVLVSQLNTEISIIDDFMKRCYLLSLNRRNTASAFVAKKVGILAQCLPISNIYILKLKHQLKQKYPQD